MSISESSLQPVLSSSGFMLVSVMAGVTRSEVSSCYKVRTQSHTFTLTFSLLGGCHVDKLHRLGPRDPRPGLRGVSDSVPGDEDDLYLSLSIIPRVKAYNGCEGWTWTDGSSEDFPLYCWMFSHLSGLAPYSHCLRKENKSSIAY